MPYRSNKPCCVDLLHLNTVECVDKDNNQITDNGRIMSNIMPNTQVDPAAYDKEKDKPEKTNQQHEEKEEKFDKAQEKKQTSLGFFHAFAASISVIIVSELGDKTFFIAAILAMKHSR